MNRSNFKHKTTLLSVVAVASLLIGADIHQKVNEKPEINIHDLDEGYELNDSLRVKRICDDNTSHFVVVPAGEHITVTGSDICSERVEVLTTPDSSGFNMSDDDFDKELERLEKLLNENFTKDEIIEDGITVTKYVPKGD